MKHDTIEHATVRVACEVSFQVGTINYGTLNVPVGAKVQRIVRNGKASDWWLTRDEFVKLCPESAKLDGKPCSFYMHDAVHYGISLPFANVASESGVAKHRSFHY